MRLGFRLRLPAIPEAVPLARKAMDSLCERAGIQGEQAEHVRLAVSEACTNCVLHAYGGDGGPPTFALDACVGDDLLLVVVRDAGVGIAPDGPSATGGLGLGLGLIQRLAVSSDVVSAPGRGTRVAMQFATRRGCLQT